jgi:hypothetical protein
LDRPVRVCSRALSDDSVGFGVLMDVLSSFLGG